MANSERSDQQVEEYSEQQDNTEEKTWNMSFDGVACREGAGAGVCINHPKGDSKLCSYKLVFECTNNMAEYEALILGLKFLK
jgi:ribonuclease HI